MWKYPVDLLLKPLLHTQYPYLLITFAVLLSFPLAIAITILSFLYTPVGQWFLESRILLCGPIVYIITHVGSLFLILAVINLILYVLGKRLH